MLIDELMPTWDAVERHATDVHAGAPATYDAIRRADLAASPVVRSLLALRSLPAVLASGRSPLAAWHDAPRRVTLGDFVDRSFGILAEESGREIVLGLEGRFWKPTGDLRPVSAATFARPIAPGCARAVWSFDVEALGTGRARLRTETRVRCADAAARRRFGMYWLVVRPFSGIIRRFMLQAIRREAEGRGAVRPGTHHSAR